MSTPAPPEKYVWTRPRGVAPSGAEPPEAEVVAGGPDAYQRALAYLQTRFPTFLVDPIQVRPEELRQAVTQAVTTQSLTQPVSQRLIERILAQLVGAGDIETLMRDPAITEIVINGAQVFVERQGRFVPYTSLKSREAAIRLAEHLLQRVQAQYRDSQPIQNITWPTGDRVAIVHHSLSPTGVQISIRKRADDTTWDLYGLVGLGMLSEACATDLLTWCRGRLNIIIAGAMGSGKTAFLRALARVAIAPEERVGVLEDTEELRLQQWLPHVVSFVVPSTREDAERTAGRVTIQDVYREMLRLTIQRLIMGEVRGPEAFDLLESTITDVGGILGTIHTRRPEDMVERLYWIGHRNGIIVPWDLMVRTAGKGIDIIVQLEKDGDGHRHVMRVVESHPSGDPTTLWRWDPEAHATMPAGRLSAARASWVAEHTSDPSRRLPE